MNAIEQFVATVSAARLAALVAGLEAELPRVAAIAAEIERLVQRASPGRRRAVWRRLAAVGPTFWRDWMAIRALVERGDADLAEALGVVALRECARLAAERQIDRAMVRRRA